MALTVQTWPQISKTERFGIGFVGTNVSQPSKCKETVFLNLFVAFCYSKIKYRKGSFQHEDKSALRLVFKAATAPSALRASCAMGANGPVMAVAKAGRLAAVVTLADSNQKS